MTHLRAEQIVVDDDDGRYTLVIDTVDEGRLTLDIHDTVLEFYASVQKEIRPYVLEAEHAKATMPLDTPDTAYELDDPKHPTFYERMVD